MCIDKRLRHLLYGYPTTKVTHAWNRMHAI